jgi:hypothetical protein
MWYHTHVTKTTIYVTDALKTSIELEAQRRGTSEAEVIRAAIREFVGEPVKRSRHGGIIAGAEPIAEHLDDYLTGFGEWR